MVKITLSLWDCGGQERFDFFKTDFFKGCASVGLVFDLTSPDTFDKVDKYFEEIRERSGNVPILLIGNKYDLMEEIGETVPREKIIQKVNQYNLFEYVETSALKDTNVDKLFYRLAITALLDLRPRLGEIIASNHIRFKILLAGAATVGKSSLIEKFAHLKIEHDYKITVGLDLMTQDIVIPDEDLPKEVLEKIRTTSSSLKNKSNVEADNSLLNENIISKKKSPVKKYGYFILTFTGLVLIIYILINYFL